MIIDICLTTDDNYAKYCGTVITSALENRADGDELVFHILHGGLKADNIQKLSVLGNVKFYELDDNLFSPFLKKSKIGWTVPSLYRLKMASILDLDKVLYLDCDTIVTSSLKSYFEQDLDGYSLGVVPDVNYEAYMDSINVPKDKGYFYFNAGSLLMNLKQFRQANIEEQLFKCLEEIWQHTPFSDQDVLNKVLHTSVKKLDKRYNYLPTFVDLEMPKTFDVNEEISVIHYAGQKPWEIAFRSNIRNEFWKYYKKSGFVSEKEYAKEYGKFKLWNLPIVQLGYLLKLYPFVLFQKAKRPLLKAILTD